MAVRRMARVLLPLVWVNSSSLSHGNTPYGASIIAFGLNYIIFAISLLHVVWREHYRRWPGSVHLYDLMAVRRVARVLLPLARVTSSLPSNGCTSYGASIAALGLG